MLLESIEAEGFRNLKGRIALGSSLNILSGENGQGKTNFLEAVGVLATTRSFRTSRLQETIRFDEERATVRGLVRESPEIVRELQITIAGNAKALTVNGKKATAREYLGQLHAVIFNADGLEIIRGQPDARRSFLDDGIISLHPPFAQTFTDYNRVIKQKNALLQNARDEGLSLERTSELLLPWNEQLATAAAKIHRARVRFVERVNAALEKKLFAREELAIRYASRLENKGDLGDYETLIRERLGVRIQAEVAAGRALIGPHRDDLEITFDGHDIRRFGSAGQQRSALLLLLLANIAVFHSTRGEYPLFMIDDIDAELDYKRIGRLLDFLAQKTQTIVTTSKESFVDRFGSSARLFRIMAGEAKSY